jgi:hypothetical protein
VILNDKGSGGASREKEIEGSTAISIKASHDNISLAVHELVGRLFFSFGGYEIKLKTVQAWTQRLFTRKP